MSPQAGFPRLFALCLIPFALVATMNSAGYRFGASDQAFYAPAMLKAIDPALYPRDADLIRSQAKLTLVDNVIGPIARATSIDLPALFVALQSLVLALLAAAGIAIGRAFYRTQWATVGLLAGLTLRHAIMKSGTNTLEGYFHPRQLSFALGAVAIAAFVHGRYSAMAGLLIAAGALHPTTASWLAIWLGVAVVVQEGRDPRVRKAAGAIACVGIIVTVWVLTAGPLSGRLVRMDPEWLATLASRDYLFPLRWPLETWLVNGAYAPLIWWIYSRRRDAGLLLRRETALVVGCLSLVVVFLAALPFHAMRVALAIQLQPARVFWMLDFMAVVYVVWALAEGRAAAVTRARTVVVTLILLSLARGSYGKFVTFSERRLVQVGVIDDDWGRAMAWARASNKQSSWLAHPEHAAQYGTSVRVAGQRDVFVEAIKDAALGMYDRGVALRTRDRGQMLRDFDTLTAPRARALAREYDLDYLITEQPLDLPEAFRSGPLRIYRLR